MDTNLTNKIQSRLKNQKQEKQDLKKLKKYCKNRLIQEKKFLNEEIKKTKNNEYLTQTEKEDYIKNLKSNYKIIKYDNQFLIEDKKEKILQTNFKLIYFLKKQKFLTFVISLIILFMSLTFAIYIDENKPNYNNEKFSFKYNEQYVFIDEYLNKNLWVVSTGGGLYDSTNLMIAYSENEETNVEWPLLNFQKMLDGEISNEIKEIKKNKAIYEYILTINDLQYRVISKSIKKDDKILAIIYINSGVLSDEYQAYLYQVYDSIKLE